MARYIDAENVIKDIRELAEKHHSNGEYEFANGVLKAITRITSQPTADVKEVVRGEWGKKYDDFSQSYVEYDRWYFVCSNCKLGTDKRYNFCPNCGADMRGGEK